MQSGTYKVVQSGFGLSNFSCKQRGLQNIVMLSLQKKCIKACHEKYKPSKRPTMPGELADEENDPRRPRPSGGRPRPPRPSGGRPRPPRPSGGRPRPPFKPVLVSRLLYNY